VLPAGVFLLAHAVTVAQAAHDPELLTSAWPPAARLVVQLVFVWAPLALHSAYGIGVLLGRLAAPQQHASRARVVARLTAFPALAFVVAHTLHVQAPQWTGHKTSSDLHHDLCATLSTTTASGIPLAAAGYLLGTVMVVVHFACGLHVCGARTALGAGASRRWLTAGCAIIGAGLSALCVSSIVYFATGALPWQLIAP
jgi:hypothetical protein